jgi:hypothetical protein
VKERGGIVRFRLRIWKLGRERIEKGRKGDDVPYAEGKIMTFTCF